MTDQIIICTNCGQKIPLTDALTNEVKQQLKIEMDLVLANKEKEIILIKKQAEAEFNHAIKTKEQDLANKEKEIILIKQQAETEINQKIDIEKRKIWAIAQAKAIEQVETKVKDLEKSNAEKDKQVQEMREQELNLRQQQRVLEDKEKNLRLELTRQLDEERKKLVEDAQKNAQAENYLKLAEKDKQMDQMRRQIDDLKRKSEQASMQIQGDTQEEDLKHNLQTVFAIDTITDVPTGVKGADLIQTVNSSFGQKAGTILWESKNTKTWSKEWLKKLKDDQSLIKADVCVLVSQTLPDDIDSFAYKEGVWICNYKFAIPLVCALRLHLLQIYQIKSSLVGKDQKMEILYNYLSGNEFKTRIENIVSAFTSMKIDLDAEKRAMQKIWSKREKEIERVINNTSGMYGDLQGIIGASLPTIQLLEINTLEDEKTTLF